MSNAAPLWNFTNHVEIGRRQSMLAVKDWDAVRRIVLACAPTFAGFEPRHDRMGVGGFGATRASVRLAMHPYDADIVYNSPVGIRAQYCLGVGGQCNRELIDALIPACISVLRGADRQLAEQSLRGADAKLCLDRNDIPNVEEIHINYAPWIACLGQGERFAETGVLAPLVEAIWIKGAWVVEGREWRDPIKADRDEKFRKYGFG